MSKSDLTKDKKKKIVKSDFPSEINTIIELADKTIENIRTLEKQLVLLTKKPASLFYHLSYILGRLEDIKVTVKRISYNRQMYASLSAMELKWHHTHRDPPPGKPYPESMNKILNKQGEIQKYMQHDLESLYIFGNLLLDQWAYFIGYLTGHKDPSKYDYKKLVNEIQENSYNGTLSEFWNKHKSYILWFFFS